MDKAMMMMRAGGGKKVKGGCVCERERERGRERPAGRPMRTRLNRTSKNTVKYLH